MSVAALVPPMLMSIGGRDASTVEMPNAYPVRFKRLGIFVVLALAGMILAINLLGNELQGVIDLRGR